MISDTKEGVSHLHLDHMQFCMNHNLKTGSAITTLLLLVSINSLSMSAFLIRVTLDFAPKS